jgi:hypothetical protein
MVAERNWQRIEKAPEGAGDLLLRSGPGILDAVFIGYQDDDGRWLSGQDEVKPTHFAIIPPFDAEGIAA